MDRLPIEQYDKIHIRDLVVRCIIGIEPLERKEKQDVIINITLYTDIKKSAVTDNISDTVDYKKIKKRVLSFVENSSFYLLETLAEEIAKICLDDNCVKGASVVVDKPGALRFARSVAVEITRVKT
ncbi:MAG: dihydroneopterin aldolase [Candidatus Hydrogenedentes bacterium]|nr:dihydroneopterin aldolase [Candidatus Hydrogenedentota bacterium]